MTEIKILICDDDPALQGLLRRRVKKMGIEPDIASDGREALNFVKENNYDLIVTDIYMPEATGLEVLQFAKQQDSDTQVVIITSSATLDNAIDSLNHGAFGYLTKPFDHLIVFDNMISRAIEYRHLLVAERHKAEAQKRRGDMLEEEVTERVQQLQKKQKGLLDLLGSLPDGILVIGEGGQVVLSSPVGERWLEHDRQSDNQPIHAFIKQIHSEMAETNATAQLGDHKLQLLAVDFPNEGDARRRAVIIRETVDDTIGAGSLVTDTVMGIKKGLATLYEQGLGTEVVLNLANQFAVLEQLSGWSSGTGELTRAEVSTPKPAQTQPQVSAPEADVNQADQSAPPVAEDPQPTELKSVPPFAIPRERVPTGELDEPRLNTGELADALRAAADEPAGEVPEQASVPTAPDEAVQPEPPASAAQDIARDTQPAADESQAQEPAATSKAEAESAPAFEPEAEVRQESEQVVKPEAPDVEDLQEPEPTAEVRKGSELAAEAPVEPEPAAEIPQELEPAAELAQEYEHATESGAEVPEQLVKAQASAQPQTEAADSSGKPLDDASHYSPRVIPEQVDAKLETPTELPANGRHGPIKIQTKLADTQIFRKVLAGMSGSEVEGLSGEKVNPPKRKPKPKAKSKVEAKPARPAPEPVSEPVLEAEPEPVAAEPEPEAVTVDAGSWPPQKPSEDDDWDDTLDTSS